MFGGAPIRLATGVVAVALAMVVGMGLASPDFAFAAAKPVVTHVSPATGSTLGGTTVRISGKHFMANGHSLVKRSGLEREPQRTFVCVPRAGSLSPLLSARAP
jgi:di/tricarboxylate transporter